jgi:hypothetical protein
MSKFFDLLNQYYYFWGAGLIVIGLILAFFGNKSVNFVIYVMATIAFFLVVSNLFFNWFMNKVHKEWVQWTFIALIFIIANMVGYLLVRFRKYGIAILAAVAGAMIGFILARTFSVGSKAGYWSIVVGCAFVLAIVAFFIERMTIMFVTSFTGSYLLIRGISLYAGGFPNEIDLQ